MKYAESNIFSDTTGPDGKAIVVEVRSKSNPNKNYRVDLTNGRCSCPAWIFQKGGVRKPCKHLRELGYEELKTEITVKEPAKEVSPVITVTEDLL